MLNLSLLPALDSLCGVERVLLGHIWISGQLTSVMLPGLRFPRQKDGAYAS
jgi:hypothetical protein